MKRVPLIQLGMGNVGRALVRQVLGNRAHHEAELGLRLDYVALCDRDGAIMVAETKGLGDERLEAILQARERGRPLRELKLGYAPEDLVTLVDLAGAENAMVVDVTATDATIPALLAAHERGYRLVMANKLPLTASYQLFQQLTKGRRIGYETTVGAGLPVIATLQALLDTGDRVERIQGCLSGTLGYICARLEEGEPFSAAVRKAKELGYTEPDPREDLSGRDVARKALILARILGDALELKEVAVESLFPTQMEALSADEFMAQLESLDAEYERRRDQARAKGCVLRYVAEVDDQGCRVGLQAVPAESRIGHLKGPENIVLFQTERYHEHPLTISGPGAGIEVTAAGVLGDILALAGAGDIEP